MFFDKKSFENRIGSQFIDHQISFTFYNLFSQLICKILLHDFDVILVIIKIIIIRIGSFFIFKILNELFKIDLSLHQNVALRFVFGTEVVELFCYLGFMFWSNSLPCLWFVFFNSICIWVFQSCRWLFTLSGKKSNDDEHN